MNESTSCFYSGFLFYLAFLDFLLFSSTQVRILLNISRCHITCAASVCPESASSNSLYPLIVSLTDYIRISQWNVIRDGCRLSLFYLLHRILNWYYCFSIIALLHSVSIICIVSPSAWGWFTDSTLLESLTTRQTSRLYNSYQTIEATFIDNIRNGLSGSFAFKHLYDIRSILNGRELPISFIPKWIQSELYWR